MPGRYQGSVSATVGGQEAATLPLTVEVRDILLHEPEAAFLVYHQESYMQDQFVTPRWNKSITATYASTG